jgi:hypothetical protein
MFSADGHVEELRSVYVHVLGSRAAPATAPEVLRSLGAKAA